MWKKLNLSLIHKISIINIFFIITDNEFCLFLIFCIIAWWEHFAGSKYVHKYSLLILIAFSSASFLFHLLVKRENINNFSSSNSNMASTVWHLNVLAFGKKWKKSPPQMLWKIAFLLVEMNWLIKGLSSNLDCIASIAETIVAAQHIWFHFSFKKEIIFIRWVFKLEKINFWAMVLMSLIASAWITFYLFWLMEFYCCYLWNFWI